jgi:hypothetical protein
MLVILALLVGDPMWSVNVDGQFDYRPGDFDQVGFGFGIGGRRHELQLGPLSVWGGADFFYDRYSQGVRVMGSVGEYDDNVVLTTESFLVGEILRYDYGLLAIELGGAAGLAYWDYLRPNPTGGGSELTETDFAVRAIGAAAYQFWHDTAIEFRLAYTHTYLSTQAPRGAEQYSIGIGGVYRF